MSKQSHSFQRVNLRFTPLQFAIGFAVIGLLGVAGTFCFNPRWPRLIGDLLLVLLGTAIFYVFLVRFAGGQLQKMSRPIPEEEWRFVFDAIDEAIIMVDEDGLIIDINEPTLQLYEYSRDELIAKKYTELQTPYQTLVRSLAGDQCLNDKEHFSEAEHQRKNGKKFSVEVRIKPVRLFGQKQWMLLIRDVSERKRTEAALAQERFLFETLMQNITDSIFFKDLDGRFIRVNQMLTERLGCSNSNELIGKTDFDFFTDEHAQLAFQDDRTVITTGEPIIGKVEKETMYDRESAWVSTTKLPLRKDGTIIGTFGVSRDITVLKRAEEAVRRHERFLANIFSSIQDGICVLDADLNIVQVNEAMEQWYAAALPLVGKKCHQAYHQLDTPCASCPSLRTFASGKVESELVPKYSESGGLAGWFELHSFPLVDLDTGTVTGVIEYVRDVTERKKVEDELKQLTAELAHSNAELEQFAYVASHDLQEPLRMVASYVQLLGRRYKGKLDDDADEFIGYAVDGASRMKDLINDLLIYSRVGTQGKPFEETDCNEVLQRSMLNLELAIEDNNATVTSEPLPTLLVDPSQLTQLFQNLIGNAMKFHNPNIPPEVRISATPGKEGWTFAVRDNGIGIDKQYQDRVFAIFQRLHTREEYPGTGIGLSVCKKIVERHGGNIWIESEVGQGCTFLFTIPTERGN